MIAILSPAKNMREIDWPGKTRRPTFARESAVLLEALRQLMPWELEKLMKVSSSLGEKAHYAFAHMDLSEPGTPAITTYDGLVFKHFDADSLTPKGWEVAEASLRILSGFYGVLRPQDGIMPYRLEMGTKLSVGEHQDLYAFWGQSLHDALYAQTDTIINLASEEYAKTIRRYLVPEEHFIDIEFKIIKAGKMQTITTYAKMARGRMARFIVENPGIEPEDLKVFDALGFRYDASHSTNQKMVFIQG
ncbi:peroxide stress protein YaaA [Eubacterium sp.]|uniref:peroxide stress protein YaaA n=1 Tax=Eubacterium sp. TaxID=142586 RepID=UPI002FC93C89